MPVSIMQCDYPEPEVHVTRAHTCVWPRNEPALSLSLALTRAVGECETFVNEKYHAAKRQRMDNGQKRISDSMPIGLIDIRYRL